MPAVETDRKGLLRFITCGSVDDGKSTLLGRLLYDAGMLADDQIAALVRDSARLHADAGDARMPVRMHVLLEPGDVDHSMVRARPRPGPG